MAKKKELTLEERIEQALVPQEEWPYELPDGWKWIFMEAVANVERGITFPAKAKSKLKIDGMIPCLRTANVQEVLDIDDLIYIDHQYYKNNNNKLIRKNDIMISMANSRELVGKTSYVEGELDQYTFGGFISAVRTKNVNPRFLFYYLRMKYYSGAFMGSSTQTTNIANISLKILNNLHMPLPDNQKQDEIVGILDTQFEKLDRAKELIQNAIDSFEDRKAAILHKAFTGELTKQWREENESVELDTLIEKEIDLNTLTDHRVILEERYSLPDTWRYCYLENIVGKLRYGTSSKSELSGDYPVLRMGNIQNGYIDWLDLKYTSDEDEYNKFKLNTGDLVFNRTNSPELVGKTAIYNGEMEALFAGYLIKIEAKKNIVLPEYLNYFMNSGLAKDYCYEVKTDGVSQSNINAKKLGKFPIPICSINEQKVVIDLCNRLISSSEEYMRLVDMVGQIDQIKKSILSKAFRGLLLKDRNIK